MDDKNKGGRPRIELTKEQWDLIDDLCKIHCTGEEIAGVLKISYDTLNLRIKDKYDCSFADYFKKASANGKASLRKRQFNVAMSGNVSMLIWLGKQYLGQFEKQLIEDARENYNVPESFQRETDS